MVVTHGAPAAAGRHALTIGNFDGVHRGHRAMLERVAAQARASGAQACALTFEPLPQEFFARKLAPPRLSRLREKLELFAAAGIDRAHVARFDAQFAAMQPERFVDEFLVHGLGANWVLVGGDFRFGARRAGDARALAQAGARHGFGVEVMPEVTLEGERVSSSAVREALEAADFARAERLLGRAYAVSGRVAHGRKLGRELGFPTANIVLPRRPPLAGVYVVEVHGADPGQRDRWLPGVASVGRRPTVNELEAPLLEVHLFNFAEELYGRHLRVKFLERLREERKYPDLATLRAAIADDARRAKDYFATHG